MRVHAGALHSAEEGAALRTTIELPEEKRALLVALAAKRGLRGYSVLNQ